MNIRTILLVAAVLSVSVSGLAAGRTAKEKEEILVQTGGFVERPNTKKGCVLFLNKQTKVAAADLEKLFRSVYEEVPLPFVLTNTPCPGVGAVVEIIDDPSKPTLLAAPDDWWASVNVAKLGEGLKNEFAMKKFLPARTRKEMIRAVAFACGVGASQFPGNLLHFDGGIRELDRIEEFFPVDVASRMTERLRDRGVAPAELVTYADACEEGWAKQPADKYQKGVWEKVHQLPTNPLPLVKPTK